MGKTSGKEVRNRMHLTIFASTLEKIDWRYKRKGDRSGKGIDADSSVNLDILASKVQTNKKQKEAF